MVAFNPKPHVSPAIARLRHGVTFAALVLALCAAAQMLVFGFVHFTQVRWIEPTPQPAAAPAVVTAPTSLIKGLETPPLASARVELKPPRTLSDTDATLHTVSDLAVTGGVMATLCLAAFAVLGMIVAAGQGTPGVDQASSASMWAVLIGMAALPWHDVLPSVPWTGVFGPYATMTAMSDGGDSTAGAARLFAHFLVMPLSVMLGAFVVLARFRAGVEAGVIVTSVSEVDERLEREMASIRSKGVDTASARSIAALNRAIGETPAPIPEPIPMAAPATSARRGGLSWLTKERRMGAMDPGEGLKRPI
jgi:hypothetical protein